MGSAMHGCEVVTQEAVIEAGALSQGTSAQKAELIALTRALQLAVGPLMHMGPCIRRGDLLHLEGRASNMGQK